MLVPVAVCVAIGLLIDKKFGTYWVFLFLFLGMAAGGRNIYKMAMSTVKADEHEKDGKDNDNEKG